MSFNDFFFVESTAYIPHRMVSHITRTVLGVNGFVIVTDYPDVLWRNAVQWARDVVLWATDHDATSTVDNAIIRYNGMSNEQLSDQFFLFMESLKDAWYRKVKDGRD